MSYRHLIWDFDGTLFDTYPPLIRSIQQALADFGCQESYERLDDLLSITLAHCFEVLVEEHRLDAFAFDARIEHYQDQTSIADRPPIAGAICICERFRETGGGNYIYTHRDHASLKRYLDHFDVTDLFDGMVTRDAGYPRKPHPAGFQALLDKYGLPAESVLAIGDRDLDIQGAQRAGLHACLYGRPRLPSVTPEYTITDFAELGPILHLDG